ncbi:hypothetical protein OAC78_05740 [Litorivicinus sp.]|nr:hypothetical protein [Litorivicinus sp.]
MFMSSDAVFHRFADFFRGFFLVCFSLIALLGFVGTGYFSYQVVAVDVPSSPNVDDVIGFQNPTVGEFELFAGRLLEGTVLWPQVRTLDSDLSVDVGTDLTDTENKAIQGSSALLESLIASRGAEKDEQRREQVSQLIRHTHQRIQMQPGSPEISFATLFFDHLMEASMQPSFFPTQASVAGQTRQRVNRFLAEYPLLHVTWFAQQVLERASLMARGSDRQESALADYRFSAALADQRMQRNAVLTLVSLVIFALSALLFLLIRIERNQTLQTQYMANRYVMYMPTPNTNS